MAKSACTLFADTHNSGCNTMDTSFIDDRHMETFRLTIDSLEGVR